MIRIPLYNAEPLTVGFAPELDVWERKFAVLLGLEIGRDAAEGSPCVHIQRGLLKTLPQGSLFVVDHPTVQMVLEERTLCYRVFVQPELDMTERRLVSLFRFTVLLAILSGMFRSGRIAALHGVLLEDDDGRGMLLCGQSGIGKSTTMRRWKAGGGKVYADDLVLLEEDGTGGYMASPFPTWSRCRQKLEGECFPVSHKVELKALLEATRSQTGREYIGEVTEVEYFSAVYNALFLHMGYLIKDHPEKYCGELAGKSKDFAVKLAGHFKPGAFFADLNADIRKTFSVPGGLGAAR